VIALFLFYFSIAQVPDAGQPAPGPSVTSDTGQPAPGRSVSSDTGQPPPAATGPSVRSDIGQPDTGQPDTGHAGAFEPFSNARLTVELELYAQGRWTAVKTGDDPTELRLDRGELGARVGWVQGAAAELRVEAIRSAADGGALGIDGDTTVIRVKRAQLLGSHELGPVTMDGAIGFVPDPWIAMLENGYSVKPLSRTGSERLLGWPTSDLAAQVRAAYGPVRVSASIGNGEGLAFPERNTGKTTTAVAEVVPVHTADVRVALAAMGRDGSLGPALVRDRRAGGAATVMTPYVRGGGEVVRAWGIGDVGAAQGWLMSGWAEAPIAARMFAAARGSTLGFDGGGRSSTFGGAVGVNAAGPGLRLWLAVDRVTTSGDAMPIAGGDAGDATTVLVIASAIAPYVFE